MLQRVIVRVINCHLINRIGSNLIGTGFAGLGKGYDVLHGDDRIDELHGYGGNDSLSGGSGGNGDDDLDGGPFAQDQTSGDGNDFGLLGGPGNDRIDGDDTLLGEEGDNDEGRTPAGDGVVDTAFLGFEIIRDAAFTVGPWA